MVFENALTQAFMQSRPIQPPCPPLRLPAPALHLRRTPSKMHKVHRGAAQPFDRGEPEGDPEVFKLKCVVWHGDDGAEDRCAEYYRGERGVEAAITSERE